MTIAIICYSAFLAVLLTGAQILFKIYAVSRDADVGLDVRQFLPLGGALILYFVVFVLYAQALRKLELSLLYPSYTALSVLLTYLAGVWVFREQFTLRAGLGCVLLIVSLYLIATSNGGTSVH